jgi:hypothetical protein
VFLFRVPSLLAAETTTTIRGGRKGKDKNFADLEGKHWLNGIRQRYLGRWFDEFQKCFHFLDRQVACCLFGSEELFCEEIWREKDIPQLKTERSVNPGSTGCQVGLFE